MAVGVLMVYFVAPDDSAAASVIDWVGGPDVGPGDGSVTPFPSAVIDVDEGSQLTWVGSMGAEPAGDLPEEAAGKVLATLGEGERVVYRLPQAARDALALLATDPEDAAAEEVLEDLGDLDEVVEEAPALIALAAEAQHQDRAVYCWLCV